MGLVHRIVYVYAPAFADTKLYHLVTVAHGCEKLDNMAALAQTCDH